MKIASVLATALAAPGGLVSASWLLIGSRSPLESNACTSYNSIIIGSGDHQQPATECAPLYTDATPADGYHRFVYDSNEDCTEYGYESGCGNYVSVMRMFADASCTEQVGDDHIEWWCDEPDPAAQYYKLDSLI